MTKPKETFKESWILDAVGLLRTFYDIHAWIEKAIVDLEKAIRYNNKELYELVRGQKERFL